MTERYQPLGLVEHLSPFRIRGWAFDRCQPGLAVDLALRVDGALVHCFRPNLLADNIARYLNLPEDHLGPTGFDIAAPELLADGREHQVEVIHLASGKALASTASTVQYTSPHAPLGAWETSSKERAAGTTGHPLVSIIVLNRNGQDVLQALLESWQKHNRCTAVEWIVIDHASTDGSLALLRRWKTRLRLRVQALPANDSFSASCNLGARLARGRYLLFLNNDIVWIDDALPPLLETLEHDSGIGAVGMKLLKTTAEQAPGSTMPWTEVQHLGVRFKENQRGYWPYEATPTLAHREAQYTPQQVPAVTGAVLLCRKKDFEAVGGFDPAYFYGYEDVEFCLRLSHRLGKRIVCRNDLAALHRHGHSRLTGRERHIFDRIRHNATVLDHHLGLWVKRAWWHSLLAADHLLCTETLTIGLQVRQLPPTQHTAAPGNAAQLRQQQATGELALQLQDRFPRARIVLVHPGINPHDVRGLHVLVVTTPDYDIRRLQHRRSDLRCIAYVTHQPKAWTGTDWWHAFDGYVCPQQRTASTLARSSAVLADTSTAERPLGRWLMPPPPTPPAGEAAPDHPVRIAIRVPSPAPGHHATTTATWEAAQQLHRCLKQQGAACWLEADDDTATPRMVHIHIHVLEPKRSRKAQDMDLAPGCLNVIWQLQAQPTVRLNLAPHSPQPDLWLHTMPRLDELLLALETRIGHTFSAP